MLCIAPAKTGRKRRPALHGRRFQKRIGITPAFLHAFPAQDTLIAVHFQVFSHIQACSPYKRMEPVDCRRKRCKAFQQRVSIFDMLPFVGQDICPPGTGKLLRQVNPWPDIRHDKRCIHPACHPASILWQKNSIGNFFPERVKLAQIHDTQAHSTGKPYSRKNGLHFNFLKKPF